MILMLPRVNRSIFYAASICMRVYVGKYVHRLECLFCLRCVCACAFVRLEAKNNIKSAVIYEKLLLHVELRTLFYRQM